MFTLLRDDRFSRAINSFKQKEQRITRWLDGSAQQNEPLHELFTDETVCGMSSHAYYGIDFGCQFELMLSNLGPTTVEPDKIRPEETSLPMLLIVLDE